MRTHRWANPITLCGFFLLFLMSVSPVSAHGYLVRAIPADRSVLERAPTRLQYWFSESLEPRFSKINVRNVQGQIVASGGVDPANPTALTVQIPPGTLPDGAYVVELGTAFASDSHSVVESRVFFVGETATDVAGVAANPYPQPFEIVWKTLLILSTFLLFGVYATYTLALVPVWGSAQHPLGQLPPRLIQRLHWLVVIGIVIAFVANILALIQQTMAFFNVDFMTAITTDMWGIVRSSSRAGDVWTLRMVLLVMLATLHGSTWYYRKEWPHLLYPTWLGNVWLMALIIGLQAVTSHAAGALVQPWIAIAMHWTHALASAFWVGGIAVLVLILLTALQPYEGEERQQALVVLMRVFSRLVIGVVALVIASGVYNALNWFYGPQDVASTYGATLLLKVLMVALLLAFGAMHYLALNPDRRAKVTGFAQRVLPHRSLSISSLRLESLVGALVLTAAAFLSATPIPQPDLIETETPTLTDTQTVEDVSVTLSVAPGVPGINTFDIVVEREGRPITDARVEMQLVQPARDMRTRWNTAEQVEQGLYIWSSDAIQAVGEWRFVLDVTETNGVRTRAAFQWPVTEDPSLIRPLSPLQVIVLGIVLVVVGWVLQPSAKAAAARLDWHPQVVFVAASFIVLTVVVMIFGAQFVADQQRRTEELLNPLPQIINPTLPDASSLQRGEALYQQYCRAWETSSDFTALQRELDFLRDDALYAIPARGWRSLLACTGALDELQTWDVVNYLRSLRTLGS